MRWCGKFKSSNGDGRNYRASGLVLHHKAAVEISEKTLFRGPFCAKSGHWVTEL